MNPLQMFLEALLFHSRRENILRKYIVMLTEYTALKKFKMIATQRFGVLERSRVAR